jgi:hypothetical protein
LLVQEKSPKEGHPVLVQACVEKALFALPGFDSPSWLSKIGRDIPVARFNLYKKTFPPRTSTWGRKHSSL